MPFAASTLARKRLPAASAPSEQKHHGVARLTYSRADFQHLAQNANGHALCFINLCPALAHQKAGAAPALYSRASPLYRSAVKASSVALARRRPAGPAPCSPCAPSRCRRSLRPKAARRQGGGQGAVHRCRLACAHAVTQHGQCTAQGRAARFDGVGALRPRWRGAGRAKAGGKARPLGPVHTGKALFIAHPRGANCLRQAASICGARAARSASPSPAAGSNTLALRAAGAVAEYAHVQRGHACGGQRRARRRVFGLSGKSVLHGLGGNARQRAGYHLVFVRQARRAAARWALTPVRARAQGIHGVGASPQGAQAFLQRASSGWAMSSAVTTAPPASACSSFEKAS